MCPRSGTYIMLAKFHKLAEKKKSKIKNTLVQALRLCTGRTAHRGSRGIALLFLHHGTRRGWGVSVTPRPLFTRGKDPVPIVQESGWVPGPVWTGAENLAPSEIRSPDRPACSQSLYRLSYPAQYKLAISSPNSRRGKYPTLHHSVLRCYSRMVSVLTRIFFHLAVNKLTRSQIFFLFINSPNTNVVGV